MELGTFYQAPSFGMHTLLSREGHHFRECDFSGLTKQKMDSTCSGA